MLLHMAVVHSSVPKSKAKNLYDKVNGCEVNEVTQCPTWIDYYFSLLPEGGKAIARLMYIYISPKNFVESNFETLKEYSLQGEGNSNPRNVLFGMIVKILTLLDILLLRMLQQTVKTIIY